MESVGTPALWLGFALLVVIALCVDLFLMRSKGEHAVGVREALGWSAFWIALAMVFNLCLWWYLGRELPAAQANDYALKFLTGYVLEKALAVDNLFVFLMLFNYFAVPPERQQRVLIYGVIGAIVLRAMMIFIGAALVARFHWVLYFFGLFLLFTGARMMWWSEKSIDLDDNRVLRWMSGHLRLTRGYHEDRFVVHIDGLRHYTPLFLVMVMIAVTDLIFAVDSIPAIFAITTDPFIVLTSNVFAVLGLRALFFLLASMAERFHLLNFGLAFVLMFIGGKMLIAEFWKVPVGAALAVVFVAIAGSMLISVLKPQEPPTPG